MTDSTGLFYAFAKNINDDVTYRYMITFATRDVADTWFRAVTDSVAGGYQTYAAVQRVTPQFYTHNPGVGNIALTITDARVALNLRGQIFFTLLNDRDGRILSTIPIQTYTDHISGANFYVRSVAQPDTFWYFDPSVNAVYASRDRRTRFTITLADASRPAGTIMIGSDNVFITAGGVNVGVTNNRDQLAYSTNAFPFDFSSFKTDFFIDFGDETTTTKNVAPIAQNPNGGERWELV